MTEYEAPKVLYEGDLEVKAGSRWPDEELGELLDFDE